MQHEKFGFHSLQQVQQKAQELEVYLPLAEEVSVLQSPVTLQNRTIPNRIAIQPMEGCDGTHDGAPDVLTRRRYQRFAASGAGLIWLEAVAVRQDGRANPRQLYLHPDNLDDFRRMAEEIREISLRENGFAPLLILQATHSGRYSKPNGYPEPIIAYNNPLFEKDNPIDPSRIITDDALKSLEECYAQTARLAQQAGFDGVDIKCCHRYLCCELLSAYNRPGSYGGSFENRTRFLLNAVDAARSAVTGDFLVTSRLNIYDGFPYPYGFGVTPEGGLKPDMEEPVRLVEMLHRQKGMSLLDITIGNPYVNPHVNRPYDNGGYIPPEHPLEGVSRIYSCTRQIQQAFPELVIISSGPSYLREYAPNLAAGAIEDGVCQMVGFGREAFAYPDFPKDLRNTGKMDPKKVCITCGKCTELMRAGSTAGCVIRDGGTYLPIYQRDVLKK